MPAPFPITETQIGAVAYLYGVANSGSPFSFSGAVTFEIDSADLTSTWKEKENTDTTGNVQNIIQTNFKYEQSVKFHPTAATRTLAASYADTAVTAISLTIANHKVAAFNGTWRVKAGTKINLKMDDTASMDLSLERYLNSGQNTALTGTPISG